MFDNCEHVLDTAADMVEAILSHSTTVKILATSREGLRAADEHLWPVPSLDTRAESDSAAATLFVERAEAVAPGVSLDPIAVVEICRRLDGIPLGIELAASRMVSMTVTEVRDRLNDRFRLLVGSRRGLERHQTLRHAVQWSYDLLDEDERALLNSCSVFAGGFDLAGACAAAGSDDEFATLDLLKALVRKSLLVADRSSGRTRFSMLETIRQFAEEQLVVGGKADDIRTAHARYFAGREADVLALSDSPQQREAYEWFTAELPNLRAAFRWAADRDDLDTAAAITQYAGFLGLLVEQYEPVGWAEELIEPAKAVERSRLAALYSLACQCCWVGELDRGIRYSESGQRLIGNARFVGLPFGYDAILALPYLMMGQPELWAEVVRRHFESTDGHVAVRASLAMALTLAGSQDDAISVADGLIATAESTHNPHSLSQALLAIGMIFRVTDPPRAMETLGRSLEIAQASGNQFNESHIAVVLSQLETLHGATEAAFDYITLAIRNYLDTGNIGTSRSPLATLAALLDRLGHYEPAATAADFAANPVARMAFPQITTTIAHLREVLGDERYESLAQTGRAMTNAEMATYAFEQIDMARARLNDPTTPT